MPVDVQTWRVRIGTYNAGRLSAIQIRYGLPKSLESKKGLDVLGGCSTILVTVLLLLYGLLRGRIGISDISRVRCGGRSKAGVSSMKVASVSSKKVAGISSMKVASVSCGAALLLFGLAMALSLLLMQAGDVERNPGPSILTMEDLPVLVTKLKEIAGQWHPLGVQLQFLPGTLDGFPPAIQALPRRALQELLTHWLRRTNPPPTLESLAEAVGGPMIANEQLASCLLAQRADFPSVQARDSGDSNQDKRAILLAERNLGIIKGKFASLLTDTHTELQKTLSEERIKDLHLFAISFFEPAAAIPDSTELRQIFQAITRNKLWDYRNYYPLQVIVEKFGGSAMKGQIEAYEKDLSGFQVTTKIKHYIAITKPKPKSSEPLSPQREPEFFSELSWKLDEEVADYTLDYLEHLWKSFTIRSSLPPLTALLDTVHEGCVSVTWLIRSSLALQLMEKADDLVSFFQKHPFLMVSIDGKCIYERQPTDKREVLLPESEKDGEKPLPISSTNIVTPPDSPHQPQGKYTPPKEPSRRQGGYECEFVNPPPMAFQTNCPICLNILCDPQESHCCGNSFCRTCIEQVQEERKPTCPICKKPLTMHSNMGLKRSLNQLHVRCTHQQSGCDWVGELGELDRHLNSYPTPGELLSGCEYTEIECEFNYVGCMARLPRKKMAIHREKEQAQHIQLLSVKLEEVSSKLQRRDEELAQVKQCLQDVTQKNEEEMEELRMKLQIKHTPPAKLLQERDKSPHAREHDTMSTRWAPLTLKKLLKALADVSDWRTLGINLDVNFTTLDKIERDYSKSVHQMSQMLLTWLSGNTAATWEHIVTALREMNLNSIANNIEAEYRYRTAEQISQMEQSYDSLTPVVSGILSPLVTFSGAGSTPTLPESASLISKGERPNLADAFRILLPVANYWQIIGTLMGIPSDALDIIRISERAVPTNCLRVMLDKAFKLTDPTLTWRTIAEAVELINPAKAKEIRDTYCGVGHVKRRRNDSGEQESSGSVGVPEPILKDLLKVQAGEWYALGLHLGVSDDVLDCIEKDNRGDVKTCRRLMFREWLKYNVTTYQQLVEALEAIGEETEAARLRKTFGLTHPDFR